MNTSICFWKIVFRSRSFAVSHISIRICTESQRENIDNNMISEKENRVQNVSFIKNSNQ